MVERSLIKSQVAKGREILGEEQNLPDSVYRAVIRGTSLFPQMFFAQPALAGLEAIKLVRAGDITWSQLIDSRFSQRQMQDARETIVKIHSAYEIPKQEANYFSDETLALVWSGTGNKMHCAASLFTGWMIGDEDTLKHEGFVKGSTRITSLLAQRRYHKKADALEGLWSSVVSVIQGQECQSQGEEIRESFRELYADNKPELKIDEMRTKWKQIERNLKTALVNGVNGELSDIERGLRRKIPENILEEFLNSFPTYIFDQRKIGIV